MMCPHCDHEIGDDSIDSLEGICPMCEGPLTKASSMWDDAGEYVREYNDDEFIDEFEDEEDKKAVEIFELEDDDAEDDLDDF